MGDGSLTPHLATPMLSYLTMVLTVEMQSLRSSTQTGPKPTAVLTWLLTTHVNKTLLWTCLCRKQKHQRRKNKQLQHVVQTSPGIGNLFNKRAILLHFPGDMTGEEPPSVDNVLFFLQLHMDIS